MDNTLLLVDYENVGKIDLTAIPSGVRVPFFFGASQKSVPTEFLKAALKLGDRFVPIDIQGQGKNALDFHIAFYLGEHLTRSPDLKCVILSKDKGFDPLVKHLCARGLRVKRAVDIAQAFTTSAPVNKTQIAAQPIAIVDDALAWLATMAKAKRPQKRKALVTHLHSHFSKKIPDDELQQVVDRLVGDGRITDINGALTYHF